MTAAAPSELGRLGGAAARALPAAIGLAFLSPGTFIAIGVLLNPPPWLSFFALVLLHSVYIAALNWKQAQPRESLLRALLYPGLPAGLVLAVPILAFAMLGLASTAYGCADGKLQWESPIPNLPWLWIGWAFLTLTAFPARCIGLVIRERAPLISIWRRLLLMLPFLPPVWVLGVVFELRVRDCTAPFDGWGFMEGGMFLVPLVGLFWFAMSFSMATLSAAYVDQSRFGASSSS